MIEALLSNGLKYSPDGGRITIGAQMLDNEVQISVQDEGIGMTSSQQQQVFSKFYRAKSVKGIKGTGLGLNICKLIIEGHGGRIWVSSSYGDGSTFFFRIPQQHL